jgi:hypothetical protein
MFFFSGGEIKCIFTSVKPIGQKGMCTYIHTIYIFSILNNPFIT